MTQQVETCPKATAVLAWWSVSSITSCATVCIWVYHYLQNAISPSLYRVGCSGDSRKEGWCYTMPWVLLTSEQMEDNLQLAGKIWQIHPAASHKIQKGKNNMHQKSNMRPCLPACLPP